MPDVYLYTTRFCSYCIRAKRLLEQKGVDYREIPVDGNPALRLEMINACGRRTVPQIWVAGRHVGGCSELFALERSGQLDALLVKKAAGKKQKPPEASR